MNGECVLSLAHTHTQKLSLAAKQIYFAHANVCLYTEDDVCLANEHRAAEINSREKTNSPPCHFSDNLERSRRQKSRCGSKFHLEPGR